MYMHMTSMCKYARFTRYFSYNNLALSQLINPASHIGGNFMTAKIAQNSYIYSFDKYLFYSKISNFISTQLKKIKLTNANEDRLLNIPQ